MQERFNPRVELVAELRMQERSLVRQLHEVRRLISAQFDPSVENDVTPYRLIAPEVYDWRNDPLPFQHQPPEDPRRISQQINNCNCPN